MALEPDPESFALAGENVGINGLEGRIRLVNAALAARELACGMGMDVVIVESAERPGGLLRSESANGFTFDTGGSHVLFSRNEA
ncbi:MAG: FAD-dependent oxidoreductase, partial [Nitrososphaeria archaeon]